MEFKGACWGGDLTALILGWCSAGSLADVLRKTRDLEWNDPLLRLATDVARGMRYLHGRRICDAEKGEVLATGVLHRDLKVGGLPASRPRGFLFLAFHSITYFFLPRLTPSNHKRM